LRLIARQLDDLHRPSVVKSVIMVDRIGIGFPVGSSRLGSGAASQALQAGSPSVPEPDSIDQVAAAMVTGTNCWLAQTHISGELAKTRCHTRRSIAAWFISGAWKSESGPATNLALKGSPYPVTLSFLAHLRRAGQRFHDKTVSTAATGWAKRPRLTACKSCESHKRGGGDRLELAAVTPHNSGQQAVSGVAGETST